MIPLKDRLIALESKIRVGIIGIGSIGKGLVFQTFHQLEHHLFRCFPVRNNKPYPILYGFFFRLKVENISL